MPDDEYLAGVLRLVQAYLRPMANSSADQIRDLMKPPAADPDEIAIEFGEAERLIPQLVHAGVISRRAEDMVHHIRDQLNRLEERNDPNVWTYDALEHDPDWAELRNRARQALAALSGSAGP